MKHELVCLIMIMIIHDVVYGSMPSSQEVGFIVSCNVAKHPGVLAGCHGGLFMVDSILFNVTYVRHLMVFWCIDFMSLFSGVFGGVEFLEFFY